jgi:hypothetical protein
VHVVVVQPGQQRAPAPGDDLGTVGTGPADDDLAVCESHVGTPTLDLHVGQQQGARGAQHVSQELTAPD